LRRLPLRWLCLHPRLQELQRLLLERHLSLKLRGRLQGGGP
jgi:hypothetical protein